MFCLHRGIAVNASYASLNKNFCSAVIHDPVIIQQWQSSTSQSEKENFSLWFEYF